MLACRRADGIFVDGLSGNRVGGTGGVGNVISTNIGHGLVLVSGASNNVIQGNFIGTGRDGASNLGNGASGVEIIGSSSNTVGGGAGAGNVIAFNGSGTGVAALSGTGNAIRGNSLFSNAGLGIDLAGAGGGSALLDFED